MMDKTERSALFKSLTTVITEQEVKLKRWISDELKALSDLFEEQIKAIPAGKDGRDGADGPIGPPGERGLDGKHGEPGPPGKDGLDGKDGAAGIDGKDGAPGLNGVDGKDGQDGIDGKDGQPGTTGERGEKGLDGKDGRDGRDGKDGKDGIHGRDALAIDVISVIDADKSYPIGTFAHHRGGLVQLTGDNICKVIVNGFMKPSFSIGEDMRSIHCDVEMTNGDRVRETFVIPVMIHRGIYTAGQVYEHGDCVTHSGSTWHCIVESTRTSPGLTSRDWQLIAKRGADGKDLRPEETPIPQEPVRLK